MISSSSRSRQILSRLFLGGAVVLGVFSCQTDPDPVDVPQRVTMRFTDDVPYRQPDSASWEFKGKVGPTDFGSKPGTDVYTASFEVPSTPGSDTVHLSCWRYGIRSYVVPGIGSGDLTVVGDKVVRDSLAQAVFKRHLSDFAEEGSFFTESARGVRRTYAKMLLERDSLVKGYPARHPVGMDSAGLVDEICVAMVRAGRPFDSLYSPSSLGGDRAAWVSMVQARVASGLLTSKDSLALFPPPPVRSVQKIAVVRELVAGGDESGVAGAFAWDSGMVVLDAEILKNGEVVKGLVDVAVRQPQTDAEAKWELDGRASIRARSKTPAGEYQLRITARDAKGHSASATTAFRVVDPPAGVPQVVVVEPSGSDTVRIPFGTRSIHVVARVRNPSEVKPETFTIGGLKARQEDDSTWSADVPVAPSGTVAIVGARVEGTNGVVGSEYFLALRSKDSEAPKLERATGAVDAVVPFDSTSAYLSWTVSDNHQLAGVKIAGVPAVSLGNTWWCRVPLSVGKNVVKIEAIDSTGNKQVDSVAIARAKDLQAPRIEALQGTESQELVGEADLSVMVNWIVTDNHRVEKVEIAGEAAVHAGASDVWFRYVVVKEGVNKIVVRAWDSTGNESADSIEIRKSVNPDHPVLKGLTGTHTQSVSFETTSIELGWQVLNPKCLGSVEIAGVGIEGEDGKFRRKIILPVGDTSVVVVAKDTLGNITRSSVKITRKRDTVAPVCVAGPGSAEVVDGKIRATVSWVVTDNHKLESVKIEGEPAVVVGNVHGRTVDVPLDREWIRIEAIDSCGNKTRDSLRIVGAPDTLAPRIVAGAGANNRTVAADVAKTVVSWTVVDDRDVTRVEIGGVVVDPVGALYGRTVDLTTGRNAIVVDAFDAAGNKNSSEVVIIRLDANGPEIVVVQGPTEESVPENTESIDLFFKVEDPQGVKTVTIDGKEIQGAAGVYNASVPLAYGKNSIEILAKDADGAISAKIIDVVRRDETAPVVKAKFGSAIQVGGLVDEYDLAWDVSDNSGAFTATLDGKPVACADGICAAKVPLGIGSNRFVFEAKDAAGLATRSEAAISRNDESAPVVSMVAPSDPAQPVVVSDAEAKTALRWTADDNVAVVTCTANGKDVVKGDDGRYVLEIDMAGRFGDSVVTIVAKDAEGNASKAATVTVRHPDLAPPAISLVAPAPPTTILGATDAAPKAVVRWTVSDNSGAVAATANGKEVAKAASGGYALEVDMTGRYADSVVVIAAKDAAGNVATSVSVTVRHADETPPTLTAVEPGATGGMVWVKAGEKTATVKWKAQDAVGLGASEVNGTPVSGDASGNYSVSIDMANKVGDSVLRIVAKDKAGNVSQELVATVRRDIQKPAVTKVAPLPATLVEALSAGTKSYQVKWTASDEGGLASTTINGVEFAAKAGEYSMPIDMSGKDGDSAIWIVAKDMAGNVSDTTKFAIRRDAGKPVVTKVAPVPATTLVTLGISPSTFTVQWKATDVGEISSSQINGLTVAANASGVYSKVIDMSSKAGDSAIWIVAKDAAGNVSDTTKFVIRRDAAKPVVVKVAPVPATTLVTLGISPSTFTVQWKATDAGGISSSQINGATVAANASGVYSKVVDMSSKAGDSAIWIVAKDAAGNVSDTTKFKIHRDAVAPTITGLPTDTIFLMGDQRFLDWAATDNEEVVWSGVGGVKVEKAASGKYEYMATITKQWDTTLLFVAKDAAGNSTQKQVVVRHDMIDPVVTPSAGISEVLVDVGATSALVSWNVVENDQLAGPGSIDGEAATVAGTLHSRVVSYIGDAPKSVSFLVYDRCGNATFSKVTLRRREYQMVVGGYFGLHLDRSGNPTVWGGEGIALPSGVGKMRGIAAAGRGAFLLKDDGTILAYGDNTTLDLPKPNWAGVKRIFAGVKGKDDPSVVGIFDNDSFAVSGSLASSDFVSAALASNTRVVKVALGNTFIVLLDLDSNATSWVQSGGSVVATLHGKVKDVSGKYEGGILLRTSGVVENLAGNLIPAGTTGIARVEAGLYQAAAMTSAGKPANLTPDVYGGSYGQGNFPAVFPTDVVTVASGFRFNAFMTSTGKVLAYGETKSAKTVPPSLLWTGP